MLQYNTSPWIGINFYAATSFGTFFPSFLSPNTCLKANVIFLKLFLRWHKEEGDLDVEKANVFFLYAETIALNHWVLLLF